MPVGMSAVGGRADVACQGLSGPFLANSGHSDKIVERMTISPDQAWAVPGSKRPPSPEKGMPDPMTDVIKAGAWDVKDAQGAMIKAFKEKTGLK